MKPEIQNMTVGELAKVTVRAAFALLAPTVLLAALGGVAAGIVVAAYRITITLLS
jgi:hypothetical protein